MLFKVDVETLDPVRRRLAVEVPADAVAAELAREFAGLVRSAKVPGFRPGRVPRQVLERMFGERVRAEVHGRLIQQSYAEALEREAIPAVGQPEIVSEHTAPGAELRYHATVEVKPEVHVDGYAGLAVERPILRVAETDIDGYLERLRTSLAQLTPVTDRTQVVAGDVVTVDYEARSDGRLIGRGERREIEIGHNGFPPDFDARLIGVEVGAAPEFDVTYPTDHAVAELAGKTVHFRTVLHAIAQKELPTLDDDFAKDHGECSTLAELRQRVRRQLEEEAAHHADELLRRAVVAELAKGQDVPVPGSMVQRRAQALAEEVLYGWQQRRGRLKDEAEARAHLRKELEPRAREQVKVALVLEAIARQEGLTIGDEDIDAHVSSLAQSAGKAAEQVRALYESPDARQQLRGQLLQARAIDLVIGRARITDVEAQSSVADVAQSG
ncbi:MAG: trigger factor [Candidatus Binatia bacterium]